MDDLEDLVPSSDVEEVVARLSSHPLRASFEGDPADAASDSDSADTDAAVSCISESTSLSAEPAGPTSTVVTVRRDVVYYCDGPDAHPQKHRLNLFLPAGARPGARLPCVIHIHGGGWQRGDRNAHFYGAPYMAAGYATNGFVAVAPSYRLAGVAKFPVQAIDCARAVRWVVDHADELGVDASRIFLSGHSAGGHLASLLVLHDKFFRDAGVDPAVVRGVVSISGIYNLFSPMTRPEESRCSIKTAFFQRVYVRPTFGVDQALWKHASPIEHLVAIQRQLSPFMVINAQTDLGLQNGSAAFVAALKEKGSSVVHHVVSRTTHADVTRHGSTLSLATEFIRKLSDSQL